MSKGTQTMQKIVIKKPWGVEIKDYKAGDPIPAGVKFKIFDAKDTAKIDAYADSLDESADYQKKRFLEPAYMYNESTNKLNEAYYIKKDKKYFCNMGGSPAWGPIKDFAIPFNSEQEARAYMKKYDYLLDTDKSPIIVKESAKTIKEAQERKRDYLAIVKRFRQDITKHIDRVERDIERGFAIDYSDRDEAQVLGTRFSAELLRYNLAVENKVLTESFIISDTSTNNKPIYFHYGKFTGYDWGFDKSFATKFSTKEAAEKMIEKMRQEGAIVKDMKVIEESKIEESFIITGTSLEGKPLYVSSKDGNSSSLDKAKAVKFDSEKDAEETVEKMRKAGYHVGNLKVVSEGRIAKGYENLDADEKARHLLSHPTSKYMSDLKSENITERAIRKAVKEMLGKPDKRDPQFIIDVNEEGEAPAATTTTANVANPELPLKLKESK